MTCDAHKSSAGASPIACDLRAGPSLASSVITGLFLLAGGFAIFAGLLRLLVWLAPWRGL